MSSRLLINIQKNLKRCSVIQHVIDFYQRGQDVQQGTSSKAAGALMSGAYVGHNRRQSAKFGIRAGSGESGSI
jgi:hypothetical protein